MNSPALQVDVLSKSFGGVHSVRDVSFAIEVGRRLAIIGPNGAGKTTLFQLLSGLLTPTRGSIRLYGTDVTRWRVDRRAAAGMGRTFQITNLFPNLTVMENLMLALGATGGVRFDMLRPLTSNAGIRQRAEALLDEWNLWEPRDTPVRNISYGEQRLLEIVLVLSQGRTLLLLDEPTCGLTLEEAKAFVKVLKGLPDRITILIIDHDMDVVFDVADELLVLYFGQVVAKGAPEDVRNDPKVREIYIGA
jgi:branched-chain amino acid transport system ATP-binding protein